MRKLAFLCAIGLLAALSAAAQEKTTTEITVGYSFLRANPNTSSMPSFNANGGNASVAFYPWHWLGFAADFGGYHVGQIGSSSVDANMTSYLFGPRIRLPGTTHFRPFAQILGGGAHAWSDTGFGLSGTRNAPAMAVGGGLDLPLTKHVGARLFEVNYVPTWFPEKTGGGRVVQNNVRISTGIRFRF